MRNSRRGSSIPARAVKSFLNGSAAPGWPKNRAVMHTRRNGITRMKNQNIAFEVIGAGQRRNISRSGVYAEERTPTHCGWRRGCFPTSYFERDAIELDGDRLCACGHPEEKDDRKA